MISMVRRPRNDPAQYDELAGSWWDPRGPLGMLHALAATRARFIPRPARPGALLVDVACGGGLLAPHVPDGYRHVGVDLNDSALRVARRHGLSVARADARWLPFPDAAADVVVAGEVLEHVPGLPVVVAELCRILAPGGTLVVDTIAATRLAALFAVTIGERMPAVPRRLHEPALFVDRKKLMSECARHGVRLRLSGLRPALGTRWRLVPTRITSVLFAGVGVKER